MKSVVVKYMKQRVSKGSKLLIQSFALTCMREKIFDNENEVLIKKTFFFNSV